MATDGRSGLIARSIDAVARDYQLPPEAMEAALASYALHPAEIDACLVLNAVQEVPGRSCHWQSLSRLHPDLVRRGKTTGLRALVWHSMPAPLRNSACQLSARAGE